jgi:hypothetical protein
MNIQFPKRVGTTMPSVEGWYNNTNIMKEPRKGRFTRRRQMTHDTQIERDQMEGALDRISENIQYIPRAQNNMIKVNYSNIGNPNAPKGTLAQPARNPYSIDVFRPPAISVIDMMPVSKQRLTTINTMVNPSYKQYVADRNSQNIDKIINQENLRTEVTVGKVFTDKTSAEIVPQVGSQYIQDTVHGELKTNKVGFQSNYTGSVHIAGGVTQEHLTYSINPLPTQYIDLTRETHHIDPGRYITENPLLVKDANTNASSSYRPVENKAMPTTERRIESFSMQATKSDNTTRYQWKYDQGPQTHLKAPITEMFTNKASDISKNMDKSQIHTHTKYKTHYDPNQRPEIKTTIPQSYTPRQEFAINTNRLSKMQQTRPVSAF